MKISPYQTPELRNESDAVIQVGTYGKYTPFANAENTGILDYINNNLEALKNALSGAYVYIANKASLPTSGDATKIYVTQDDGKSYKWTGTEWSLLTAQLNGLSAYEIAKEHGFTGTEEEWIASIQADTITSASVDDEGYLTLSMSSGNTAKTALKPIADCIQYRDEAKASATTATEQANKAKTEADGIIDSVNTAKEQATNASTSATNAKTYADNAKASETSAKTSETNAKASEEASANSASGASTSARKALASEQSATKSAGNALDSYTETTKIQQNFQTVLDTAKASETNAKTSETNSATSANNAHASEVNAKTSETNSVTSASNAKTSEASAKTSATDASTSATIAKNWATATTSPDGATDSSSSTGKTQSSKTWALEAKSSAESASSSATNASTSASNASKSEVEAKTAQASAEKARDDANSTLAKLTSAMIYTGQVNNYSDLDSITKSKGDVWNIVNADEAHGIKAGDNVVWNGASWDNLSGVVDLSAYAEKADYQKVITSATANGDTITFNHKDGTTSTATVNNIDHATTATNDANGNNIADTYETKADATNTYNSITSYTNRLQRNKAYSVGDIAYSPNLPSWAYLECVTAGTTGDTEPNFSTVVSTPPTNMKIGDKITDGDATFIVRSKGGVVQSVNSVHPDDTGNISIWDSLHRYPRNYVPSDTSNRGWNSLGFCIIYYDEMVINKQPRQYGQLINIPANKDNESTQLWVTQPEGTIYSRGGNGSVILNDTSFKCAGIGENGHLMFPNGAELWVS